MAPSDYADLLRGAARDGVDLLEQAPDGLILLGSEGEKLVDGRDFYAVFATDEEWRLVAGERTLGTVPLTNVLGIGSLVGFAGRRWRVEAVDDRAKVLKVVPHRSGKLPRFDRPANEPLHDRLTAMTLEVLLDDDRPAFLDAAGGEFLDQGRAAFRELGLQRRNVIEAGADTHLLTWHGTAVNSLLSIVLMSAGIDAEAHNIGVTAVGISAPELQQLLGSLSECPEIDDLASFVVGLRSAKLDDFIDEDLLRRLWARRNEKGRPFVTNILNDIRI